MTQLPTMLFTKIPNAKTEPTPFKIAVPDAAIQEFKTLLKVSKIAPATYESTRSNRKFGVTREWIKNAKTEWESFDWYCFLGQLMRAPMGSFRIQGVRLRIV